MKKEDPKFFVKSDKEQFVPAEFHLLENWGPILEREQKGTTLLYINIQVGINREDGNKNYGYSWIGKETLLERTGLSKNYFSGALKILKKYGFIEVLKKGIPARNYYLVKKLPKCNFILEKKEINGKLETVIIEKTSLNKDNCSDTQSGTTSETEKSGDLESGTTSKTENKTSGENVGGTLNKENEINKKNTQTTNGNFVDVDEILKNFYFSKKIKEEFLTKYGIDRIKKVEKYISKLLKDENNNIKNPEGFLRNFLKDESPIPESKIEVEKKREDLERKKIEEESIKEEAIKEQINDYIRNRNDYYKEMLNDEIELLKETKGWEGSTLKINAEINCRLKIKQFLGL